MTVRSVRGRLPGVEHYYIVVLDGPGPADVLWAAAAGEARRLARDVLGDEEAWSILYNGGSTRRRPWPHVHVLLTRNLHQKRWAMLCFHLKHLTRWIARGVSRRACRRGTSDLP